MNTSTLRSSQRESSHIGGSVLFVAGVLALSLGLGTLLVAESGLAPAFRRTISYETRLLLGTQGAALFVVGTLLVMRTGVKRKPRHTHTLYKVYGLEGVRSGHELQTFDCADDNRYPVHSTWADCSTGSRVCARHDRNGRFLRVEFINEGTVRACSVSIRSMGLAALVVSPPKRYIEFQARVPTCAPKYTRPGSQHVPDSEREHEGAPQRAGNVALTVRLVNGALQQWFWQGQAPEPVSLLVAGQSWKTFKIPLTKGWKRNLSEGNPEGPSSPDFNMLAGIIFDVDAEHRPPSGAYGLVDIRNIRCCD